MAQQNLNAPTSADDQAARVAEEHRLARDQLALARAHAAEAAGR